MLVFDLLALFSLSSILVLCPVVLYRCEQVDPPWHEQMSWQWHRQKNKNKKKKRKWLQQWLQKWIQFSELSEAVPTCVEHSNRGKGSVFVLLRFLLLF